MCYNYEHYKKLNQLEKRFNAKAPALVFDPALKVNGFAHPLMPVITNLRSQEVQLFSWGLIPYWSKNEGDAQKISNMTLNAKSETITEKPSFRIVEKQRCLVPFTGYFEHHTVGKSKIPYYIRVKEQEISSFAGVWDTWIDKTTGEIKNTFAIITTSANPLMSKIHNSKARMPVILKVEDEQKWLDNTLIFENQIALLKPFQENEMIAYPISKNFDKRNIMLSEAEIRQPFNYNLPQLPIQL